MSGGSWDYFYSRLEDVATRLIDSNINQSEAVLRKALGVLLLKCSKALHDIEWVDSCDYGIGDEREALEAIFENPQNTKYSVLLNMMKKMQDLMQKEFKD